MQNWINFLTLLFWLIIFSFLLNSYNVIQLLFLSELAWVFLYVYTTLLSGFTDDITLLTLSFLILGLAGLEFSFGFILVILINFFYKSTNLTNKKNNSMQSFEKHFNTNIRRYTHIY